MKLRLAIFATIATLTMGVGLVFAHPAMAQVNTGLNEVGQTIKLSATDPRIIATNIINIALGLIGIILVGLIVYAGFLYMTSGGDPEKTGTAKKIITSAVIGLVIILSAWAIARFVIDRLLQATQGGTSTTQQGGGGPGGGFGGGGVSNAFQVKSISPQGSVPLRNVQIKLLFTRPVDENSATAIVVTKNGGTTVGGTISVTNGLVLFTPVADCPSPNNAMKCFDGDSDFTIQIGAALRSSTGQSVVCGGFAPPCVASFHTGNLIDTQSPTVTMSQPLDGQAVPADSLVTLGAHAADDSGVSYVEFSDNGTLVDQSGPSASSTPLSFDASVQWDTAGIALQSVRTLAAKAFDVDTHETQSSGISVVVRSPSCFNGVKDGDETGIDCGGTPNTPGFCGACSGGSCTSNSQCSSGVCTNGICVDQPIITEMTPGNGQPGTFVTMRGVNFGNGGSVVFLGAPGAADDTVATAPAVCGQFGIQTWSPTQVIVSVPQNGVIGPVQLKNGTSNLSDATNDNHGPAIADFLVDNTVYPGLCGLDPDHGFVGDSFKAVGAGFGTSPSSIAFGSSILTSFSAWVDDQITANVPAVGIGKQDVRVKVGTISSNTVSYQVSNKSTSGPPVILDVDPAQGPLSEYVTIAGTNFGFSVGTVRFKNKISGDEALADTTFPAACAAGFWNETRVVVRVPQQLLSNQPVTLGDYSIKLIRSDNVVSNEKDFTVNNATPKPGICAIDPTVGPVGTKVTVSGDRLGATTDSVTFYNQKSAVATSWATTEIKTSVPTGAVTGPLRVTVQGVASNGVSFQVRNCNEQPGICAQSEQCCANGSCVASGQSCGAVATKSMFAWQSSTGLIPVAPRVVEECAPTQVPAPIPSPAPWDKRAGGDQVCVNATIDARFTTHLDPTTVTQANFRIKKCTSASNEPCATTESVSLAQGFPLLQPVSTDQDGVFLQPSSDLVPSTTYLVEFLTGIKGDGPSGAKMEEQASCGTGVAYCFRFKTRPSNSLCAVGGVSVVPHPFTLNDAGASVNYLASPISSDDKCTVLKCSSYDWSWEHGDNDADPRAIFQAPLAVDSISGKTSCRQVGVAMTETGNVPVSMNAIVKPDLVKGTAFLYVKFVPPHVTDYAPNCEQACVNALIWAKFSTPIDPGTLTGNVEVRQCANENCALSDLSMPLPVTILSPPKGGITTLQIDPTKPGVVPGTKDPLLQAGKFYRVLLRGGSADGIQGLNGVPMTGLNDPEGFVWIFRTKQGDSALCTAQTVVVTPIQKYESVVGAREMFLATPYGTPDTCSASGQALVQTSGASWTTSRPEVADFVNGGTLDTGGVLAAQCSPSCLAMGSQAEYGKVAVCGNGAIETTDAHDCVNGHTPFGDTCTLLPVGANAGEECDPGIAADVGRCDASSCLWKPVGQIPSGTCGNGTIQQSEACDFGSFCMGASPTSTTPNMTSCTQPAEKAACLANGGTCAPQQYRGCSAFCRHTGSKSGNSTCGNNDIANGEDCDDGNVNGQDGCSAQCLHTGSSASVVSVCGNGVLEPGETCEKASVNDPLFPDGCDSKACLHTGTSACDNDPNTPNVACCGNAAVDSGEDCDDGNKTSADGCSASCLLEGASAAYPTPSFCSDGVIGKGEQCEAGLPSNDPLLLNAPKNAAPQAPIGTAHGDGLVDVAQLATIIGNADPDANGLMSSTLTATVDSKGGDATYGLQCGFTDEASCPAGFGLTDQGCCAQRPALDGNEPSGAGVCRNALITATFNVPMDPTSVGSNALVAAQDLSGTCPSGTVQVADDFRPVADGLSAWIRHMWTRVVAWWTGDSALAAVWCAGSTTGSWVPYAPGQTKQFIFKYDDALQATTTYRIKFLGDHSTSTNPLSDNATLALKQGIKTVKGVVAPYDSSADSGPLTFSFQTGGQVCAVNVVQVQDQSTDHPLLFVKDAEQHPFTAQTVSLQDGKAVPIVPVAQYTWEWLPWSTSQDDVVTVVNPQPGQTSATIEAKNKNGNAFVSAWLKISQDTVNIVSTTGTVIQGTAPVTVSLCENPWPSLQTAPFRDKKPTGNGDDSSLTGTIFENGPYFNFSTTYCRDAGTEGVSDDLPSLQANFVPPTPLDQSQSILRQYLFTYGSEHSELKKDGIGIRVIANPLHLSPEDWYTAHGFRGQPQVVDVDGYRAIKDGTTIYVSAANTENIGEKIYSNIYLISHNPDASPVTLGIYDQMVKTLAFNVNLTDGVGNVCEEGNDPLLEPSTPVLTQGFRTIACSSDADCLKMGMGDDIHCGSYKQKLTRDTVRVADFQLMSREIETARLRNGTYPVLAGGTFLPGLSTSLWSSWSNELKTALGVQPPSDPVNQFLTCGRCSQSQAACGKDADCSSGETCLGVAYKDGSFLTSTSTEASTCWNAADHQFYCPEIGASPSRIYQFRTINNGARYELGSDFEVPMPAMKNAPWWEPPLMGEVKRCAGANNVGMLCNVDGDCGQPVVNGSCRAVGGRFVYSGICRNVSYGQSGTCGDGVIGQACAGGSNDGNACTQHGDCPGGTCSASELCELDQTKIADCVTSNGQEGLKLQVCSECNAFVDDPKISTCSASALCGNGRIDQMCSGGTRHGLGCLADADCPAGACVSSGETCDDGPLNGTYGHCSKACNGYAAYCGDGQLSPGESCDKGTASNGQYCGANCDVNQSCSLDCKGKAPYCGDTIVTSPEQCDGQTQTTNRAICTSGPGQGQVCSTDADCGTGGTCAAGNDPLATCQGKTQNRCATSMKQCVSASLNSCTGYNPANHLVCQSDADCSGQPNGDTRCRALSDFCYDCTSDVQCSYSGIPGSCNALPLAHIRTCHAPGALDACLYTNWSSCKITGFCGDGAVDKPGEECDDGTNNGDTKACTSSCKKNTCGDGKPYVGVEECDAGVQNGTVTCSADYNSTCSSCSTQCKFLASAGGYCGDTVKNGPEQCDGNQTFVASIPGLNQLQLPPIQYAACPDPVNGKPDSVCPYLNAECLQSPCQKTSEPGVSCQSLGYDFATNGLRPKLKALDPALNILDAQNACPSLRKMYKYEVAAYQACMGLVCEATCSNEIPPLCSVGSHFGVPLPSVNDFWKCVREKGPALGVGIQTVDVPQMVQCNNTCAFNGCGRCSDESGSGVIRGELIDGVYNQSVAFARVSLFYKGVLVSQTNSDGDGKFQFTAVNDRIECSQYKIIVDKYDDNLCTGNGGDRPNCGMPNSPPWNFKQDINESNRGGYWPYTSPFFTVNTYAATISPATPVGQTPRVYLFPRPGPGEAYYSVLWDGAFGNNGAIPGGFDNHLVVPNSYGYVPGDGSDPNYAPNSCTYDNRPVTINNQVLQCARDVNHALVGSQDLTKLPYATYMCLHRPGEKVGGFADPRYNGCPVEGRAACLAANGNDLAQCNRVTNAQECSFASVGDTCSHHPDTVPNQAAQNAINSALNTCYNGNAALYCNDQNVEVATCDVSWWDTCYFYQHGPLTTYFRYAAYTGSNEPLRLMWNDPDRSVHPELNTGGVTLKSHLTNNKYHAVVSTDSQIIQIDGKVAQPDPNSPCASQHCKYWHIADVDPTTGTIISQNTLHAGRSVQDLTKGIAIYEYWFQGGWWLDQNADGKDDLGFCKNVASQLVKGCNVDADCAGIAPGSPKCWLNDVDYATWSQANY